MTRRPVLAALAVLALVAAPSAVGADDGHSLEPGSPKRDNIAEKADNDNHQAASDLSVDWAAQLTHQMQDHDIDADYDAAGCEAEWTAGMEARLMEAGVGARYYGALASKTQPGALVTLLYASAVSITDATTSDGRLCIENVGDAGTETVAPDASADPEEAAS